MEASFDATSERECSVCYFDLHLSAAGCHHCSPDKYSCLNHAKQFCSCAWGSKFFLLRHDIKDLAMLVEALEGKLSAIYKWAKLDLGLSLSSYVSKDSKPPVSQPVTKEQKVQEPFQDLVKPKESLGSHESSSHKDIIMLSDDEGDDDSSKKPLNQPVKSEVQEKKDPPESRIHDMGSGTGPSNKPNELSVTKNPGGVLQQLPINDDKFVIIGLYANTGNNKQNTPEKPNRQKGPRIAKVVRRLNCNVEPLEFGVIQTGKFWCDTRAIYPKGFKSRVKYISVLDPTDSCYYVSEIVDAGKNQPLFMVSLEKDPNEVFIHLSPVKCWEMVRERVNHEISKKHKLKVPNLPPLQPPSSLDGMEMFGFSSPAISQGIQLLDKDRLCTDYWEKRPFHSQSDNNSLKIQEHNNDLTTGVGTIISGMFKKANSEELNAFLSVLNNDGSTSDQQVVTKLLNDEILKRRR